MSLIVHIWVNNSFLTRECNVNAVLFSNWINIVLHFLYSSKSEKERHIEWREPELNLFSFYCYNEYTYSLSSVKWYSRPKDGGWWAGRERRNEVPWGSEGRNNSYTQWKWKWKQTRNCKHKMIVLWPVNLKNIRCWYVQIHMCWLFCYQYFD